MRTFKRRASALGALAAMLAGLVVAGTAAAAPGPFWYHRTGGVGNGVKILASAPENIKGTGGEQKVEGKILETKFVITARGGQIKGAIFNNELQGQIKLELVFNQPVLTSPVIPGCTVVVGTNDIVPVKGHLMWKWNGEAAQLEKQVQQPEQTPDVAITGGDIAQGATGFPAGTITTVTLGSGCTGFAGTYPITGSEVVLPSRLNVGEFVKKVSIRTMEGEQQSQHFWNGAKNVGAKGGLLFEGREANLLSQDEVEALQQEVAIEES